MGAAAWLEVAACSAPPPHTSVCLREPVCCAVLLRTLPNLQHVPCCAMPCCAIPCCFQDLVASGTVSLVKWENLPVAAGPGAATVSAPWWQGLQDAIVRRHAALALWDAGGGGGGGGDDGGGAGADGGGGRGRLHVVMAGLESYLLTAEAAAALAPGVGGGGGSEWVSAPSADKAGRVASLRLPVVARPYGVGLRERPCPTLARFLRCCPAFPCLPPGLMPPPTTCPSMPRPTVCHRAATALHTAAHCRSRSPAVVRPRPLPAPRQSLHTARGRC